MKIERLTQDKIRIFLTSDDLVERGIQKEDMWREIPRVHELFSEMMDQAYTELGFDATGPLAVEVFSLPAQGMVVIVTKGKHRTDQGNTYLDDEDDLDEDIYEMEVMLEQSDIISYAFNDIEHVISAAKSIRGILSEGGSLYHYKNKWILQWDPVEMEDKQYQGLIAILSEFGEATSITQAFLEEYGKTVISNEAIEQLCTHF
jgi:adapter protein MecA 1/2